MKLLAGSVKGRADPDADRLADRKNRPHKASAKTCYLSGSPGTGGGAEEGMGD
jgi:hypothetical protein